MGDARLEERKYEAGIYKLLGAIGYLSQIGMIADGATIDVALLLPFSEYRDADLIWELLEPSLSRFVYCGLIKEFTLGRYKAFPEGAGIYTRGVSVGTDLKRSKIGVLMSGHHNQSWLRCDYGQVSDAHSVTNDLGFSRLVAQVAKAACIQQRQWPVLTQCLYAAGDVEGRLERAQRRGKAESLAEALFGPLLQAQDARLRTRERERLVQAVMSSRRQYWQRVQDWLEQQARGVDLVVFCGGSAFYWQRELKKQWPQAQWCEQLLGFVQTIIPVREQYEAQVSLDAVGVLLFMLPEEMEKAVFAAYEAAVAANAVLEEPRLSPQHV